MLRRVSSVQGVPRSRDDGQTRWARPGKAGRFQAGAGGVDVLGVGGELWRGMSRSGARHVAALVFVSLLAVGLSGCGSGGAAQGARVTVVEHDFGLVASPVSVRAGLVTLVIENRGPSTHELNVDRTSLASGVLPMRANTLQVNEDSSKLVNVGSLGDIPMRSTRRLTLTLTPGHYVLFCNLEGHYLGGMHTDLKVTS
jgi:uncharacterized cupredoxin-like copper-binding protein